MPEAVLTVVVVVAGTVVVCGGTVVVVAGRAVVDVVVGSVVVVVLVDVVETDTSCNDSGTVVVTASASARPGSTPVSGPRTPARHDTAAIKRRAIRDRLRPPERFKESLLGRLVLTLRGSSGDLKNL